MLIDASDISTIPVEIEHKIFWGGAGYVIIPQYYF